MAHVVIVKPSTIGNTQGLSAPHSDFRQIHMESQWAESLGTESLVIPFVTSLKFQTI